MPNTELDRLVCELKVTLDRVAAAVATEQAPDPEDFVVLRGSTEQVIEIAGAPIMFDVSAIQPSEAVRERNGAKVGDGDPCVVCCRRVNWETARQLHMSGDWKAYPKTVSVEDAETMPGGSMYFFPVGPECAKKIPKAYLQ